MRPVLTILIMACLWSVDTAAMQSSVPPETSVIVFRTMLGRVTFMHHMHADLSFTKCASCHHTYEGQGRVKRCHECHDRAGRVAPASKKVFHLRCIGCHEYTAKTGGRAGPGKTKCMLCHVK